MTLHPPFIITPRLMAGKDIDKPGPWNASKELSLRSIARGLFNCDQHEQHGEYREHCGACALNGYLSDSAKNDGMDETTGPNYAGWARCYVQAGYTVPLRWFKAFNEQLESDNEPYAQALKNDIATWGVRFK